MIAPQESFSHADGTHGPSQASPQLMISDAPCDGKEALRLDVPAHVIPINNAIGH